MSGRVIGVNSAIAQVPGSGSGNGSGNIGVGFAIPSDQARKTAEQLIATGKAVAPGDRRHARPQPTTGEGVRIADRRARRQRPRSPRAGRRTRRACKPGDVILELDGKAGHRAPTSSSSAIRARVGRRQRRADRATRRAGADCQDDPASGDRLIAVPADAEGVSWTLLDINGWEFVLLAVIAVVVLGPERLPEYAAKLRGLIRQVRAMADGARGQLREQMGPEFDDIDWQPVRPASVRPAPDRAGGAARRRHERAAATSSGQSGRHRATTRRGRRRRRRRHLTPAGLTPARRRETGRRRTVPGPSSSRRSAAGGGEAQRAAGQAASGSTARGRSPRSATAAGLSGSPSTTGMPASPPSRSRVSSGIWPSSGTGAPTARVSESATRLAAAGAEDLQPRAVRQREPGHVLDDADDALVGLRARSCRRARRPRRRPPAAWSRRGSRRSGRSWADRDRDVAGARRQVEQQHVEVAPVDVGEELLQRPVQHRPAPDDDLVAGA